MTDRKPTDAAIIKAFQKFEEAMNVWMAEYRNTPEDHDHDLDRDNMWRAHAAYRKRAIAAQERIDARKKGTKVPFRVPVEEK